jgi:UDP-N-acetyl-D-mannosaminuronate dehydrogenase
MKMLLQTSLLLNGGFEESSFHIIGVPTEMKIKYLNESIRRFKKCRFGIKKGDLSFMNLLFIPVVRKKIVCQFLDISGLKGGVDFKYYSPERIVPEIKYLDQYIKDSWK